MPDYRERVDTALPEKIAEQNVLRIVIFMGRYAAAYLIDKLLFILSITILVLYNWKYVPVRNH